MDKFTFRARYVIGERRWGARIGYYSEDEK